MNDAQALALRAKLIYMLLTNISGQANDTLKEAVNSKMGEIAGRLDEDKSEQIALARATVRELRKDGDSDDALNQYFNNEANQDKAEAIIALGNVFASAVRGLNYDDFRPFIPDEMMKEPAISVFEAEEDAIKHMLRR